MSMATAHVHSQTKWATIISVWCVTKRHSRGVENSHIALAQLQAKGSFHFEKFIKSLVSIGDELSSPWSLTVVQYYELPRVHGMFIMSRLKLLEKIDRRFMVCIYQWLLSFTAPYFESYSNICWTVVIYLFHLWINYAKLSIKLFKRFLHNLIKTGKLFTQKKFCLACSFKRQVRDHNSCEWNMQILLSFMLEPVV